MKRVCIHAYISGKVQGVWYRAYTRKKARQLGITGWARNLSDGRVEVMLCGEHAPIDTLLQALHQGPPMARVDNIEQQPVADRDFEDFTDFTIG